MSMFRGVTVTRQRATTTTTNAYGDTVLSWTAPSSADIEECAIAPLTEGELQGAGRAGAVVGATLYAPPNADVRVDDRIVTTLGTFEVEGDPSFPWRNPYTGNEWGLTMRLKKVDG